MDPIATLEASKDDLIEKLKQEQQQMLIVIGLLSGIVLLGIVFAVLY